MIGAFGIIAVFTSILFSLSGEIIFSLITGILSIICFIIKANDISHAKGERK